IVIQCGARDHRPVRRARAAARRRRRGAGSVRVERRLFELLLGSRPRRSPVRTERARRDRRVRWAATLARRRPHVGRGHVRGFSDGVRSEGARHRRRDALHFRADFAPESERRWPRDLGSPLSGPARRILFSRDALQGARGEPARGGASRGRLSEARPRRRDRHHLHRHQRRPLRRRQRGPAMYVSRDGGQTFDEQKLAYAAPDQTRVSPPLSMDVTAAGSLRVAVTAGREQEDRLYLLRFDVNGTMFDVVPGLVLSNFYAPLALKRRGGRRTWLVYPGPEIAVDKVPGGPHEGRLYAAWAQPQSIVVDATVDFGRYGRDFDVWLAHSDDDGVSWSTPIKVNDDGTTADQFFPSLRIDTAGTVHVAFVDRRENPDVAQFDVYYAL